MQPALLQGFAGQRVAARCGTAARPAAARGLRVSCGAIEAGVGVFGTKAGMMTMYRDGVAVPATVIALEAGNVVTAVKTPEEHGYAAVQVGYGAAKPGKLTKPEEGHCAKVGVAPMRHLREFRLAAPAGEQFVPGAALDVAAMFSPGDLVDVAGTSIGKGFQGGIKRHNFARGNMTHGSKSKREHGSTGPGTTPGRTLPGLKNAGQMGNVRVKARKSEVLLVDVEKGAIVVKGSVPGKPGNVVEIAPAKVVGKNIPLS